MTEVGAFYAGLHQGAGLYGSLPQADLRVIALVAQPGPGRLAAEQELLWRSCAVLKHLGHVPAVLDGLAAESDAAPGLAHLLAGSHWCDGQGDGALAVFPASQGLAYLQQAHQGLAAAPLPWLVPALRSFTLAVLHAPAATLATLLRGTRAAPLLLLPASKSGVLAAYDSLKQLHVLGHGCLPFAVSQLATAGAREADAADAAQGVLRDCVRRHLGAGLATTTVRAGAAIDLQRLALQWLEAAAQVVDPAAQPAAALPSSDLQGWSLSAAPPARSH